MPFICLLVVSPATNPALGGSRYEGDETNTDGQSLPEGTYYYLLDLGSVSAPIKRYVAIVR